MDDLPEYYRQGSRLSLNLAQNGTEQHLSVTAIVVEAFTPFTILPIPPNTPLAVLKVYDPRFFSHHTVLLIRPARPWTHTAEAAARSKRTAPWDPAFNPAFNITEDDDAPVWDEWYYQNAALHFRSEVAAYARLAPLQDTGAVLHCYAAGTLVLEGRAIRPHVLLLEYLPDAKTLCDVDPAVVGLPLMQSLVATAQAFGGLGVVHTDLREYPVCP
ncbi:hypothetical protein H0H81_010728 [Sphagnurus paluster]|uniref:Protein kinase domain-containing protein n=1 Tax=Sphagnurus paluster TaxID=117069 RepID=A0A9P7FNU5_9AGAR|nr:hypothetical protein H0H81_010728 [Sphagnurus paluster]